MPRLNNPRQEAVAQMKAQGYLDPPNALSNTAIIKKVYGYGQQSAEAHAPEIVGSRGVQTRLTELLNEKMTDEQLSAKMKHLINFKDKVIDKKNGRVIAKAENGAIQLAALQLMLKVKGVLKEAGTVIDARTVEYALTVSDSPISSKVLSILDNINSKLSLLPTEDSSNVL